MASYYVRSGAGGAATGADWANAFLTLAAAFTGRAAGDVFYVAGDHAETQASAMTMTSPGTMASPCFVYCVDHTGSVPPVSADLRTTATITTTGANAMSTAGSGTTWFEGIQFQCGTGATTVALTIGGTYTVLKNCILAKLGTTGATNAFALQNCLLINTTFKHSAATDGIRLNNDVRWRDTPNAIAGATIPTNLVGQYQGGDLYLDGVDLSAMGSGKTLFPAASGVSSVWVKDCKLGASVTVAATPTSPGLHILVSRTDSAGTNYIEQKYHYYGTQLDETIIVRTGGWNDGTTALSRKITTTANAKWAFPFEATPIAIWQDSTSAATATLEFIINAASLPLNDEVWFDLEYLGDASSPQGSFVTGTKADGLATGAALTASTEAWDSLATARADSTVYALGDVSKVASNAGRIFFCTTAGTSAGSEPGGYASAVDGGSVTDGSAVFRAGMRCKQTLSFTAAQKGYVYAYVKAGKASTTWYNDPKLVLA